MSKHSIDRRAFLGALGALGASALLPRMAFAQNGAPPKRLLVVFTPNGTIPDAWAPTGTETNFTFGPILDPLTPFKKKVVVLDGIEVRSAYHGDGDDHMKGMGHMLTGTELLPGNTQGGAGTPAGFAGGISIDQHIANAVGQNTRFKSLEFGAYVGSADVWSRMCYAGANQPLPPMESPTSAFTRIFAGSNVDPVALQRMMKRRQSVLDHAKATLSSLESRVGAADRARIQNHSQSVRSIEKQLLSQSTCVPPVIGALSQDDVANYKPTGRLMMDLIATSFGCDQTRIASMQFTRGVSDMSFPSIGISDGHHTLSHDGDDNIASRDKLIKINNYYAQEFAYLLGKLDGMVETDGTTVLDNTLVVWMNELAKGNAHSHNPLPVVLAGSCGKAIVTGRYIKFAQPEPHNNLLVSMGQAMGVNMTTFGNPAYCTGKLAAL